ncbi:putative hydrophobin-like protein [Rosellinia necatrix]|uniref:Putative hydrophobin-like protein n=1 Tax=Rosellinia necatrix TaxID=77044 RepID=A0A1W2TUX8_ROSNE|nr:putative hydrophobin-like protein [Rosellinia necatrix]
MQFFAVIAAVFATAVAASPLDLPLPPKGIYSSTPTSTMPAYPYPTPAYDGCPDGLYSSPQCCATDILGIADLDCHSPSAVPRDPNEFRYICATGGQRARCCVIPVAGQALLCLTPTGV